MGQVEFAELVGSSASTVCQWEAGRRIPRGPTWKMMMILFEARGILFDKNGLIVEKRAKGVNRSPMLDQLKSKRRSVA